MLRKKLLRIRDMIHMLKYNIKTFGIKYALGYMFLLNDRLENSPIPIMRKIYNDFADYGFDMMLSRQNEI